MAEDFFKGVQGLLSKTGIPPGPRVYAASAMDKAAHKITDALGISKGRATFTEDILTEDEQKRLSQAAANVLRSGGDILNGKNIYPASDLLEVLGQARIAGEDANNIYIEDKYDFNYSPLSLIGLSGLLNDVKGSISLIGLGRALAPLVSYIAPDTRAPAVRFAVPKETPGEFYSPSLGGEKAVPKPKPKIQDTSKKAPKYYTQFLAR